MVCTGAKLLKLREEPPREKLRSVFRIWGKVFIIGKVLNDIIQIHAPGLVAT